MHARELIELAALVSAHGPVLVRSSGRIPEESIEQYWTASKCRMDRWGRTLKRLSDGLQLRGVAKSLSGKVAEGQRRWRLSDELQLRGVLEEIITGEVLTRVWTAVMWAYDRHRCPADGGVEPIAQSVLSGHVEARHRVLTLLVSGSGIDAEEAVKLNRLRRRTERWTDMLIGYLIAPSVEHGRCPTEWVDDVSRFAVDPDRAKDFADDLRYRSRLGGAQQVWPLLLASLRAAFWQGLAPNSSNGDLNARIAASILSSFQPEVLDAIGLFRSAWLWRVDSVVADAQGMIDELLA